MPAATVLSNTSQRIRTEGSTLSDKFPLLITGLPGVPGFNSFFYFRKKYGAAVIGIKPAHTVELDYPGVYGISAEHEDALERLFATYKFKTVIDASGCCALKSCEYNAPMAELVNCSFGTCISIAAQKFGAQLIRFSTDLVFDGTGEGMYTEEHALSPITVYGKTMARAEYAIVEQCPQTAILRIPLPMGPSLNGHAGAVDWIEHRFARGKPATLYYDEVRSNLYIQDILSVLEFFIDNFQPGIFHLGGPLPLSLYEIGQVINKLGNYPAALLNGCWRREAAPIPPRVGNVTMDSTNIMQILPSGTIQPWPLDEQYLPSGRDWHSVRTAPYPPSALKSALYGYNVEEDPTNPLHWYNRTDYI
jgi:dTDP-4-dehydrorhamnose reductase